MIPLSDSHRCSRVRKGPIRPELSDEEFPKNGEADILVPFNITNLYCFELMLWLETFRYCSRKTWKKQRSYRNNVKMAWIGATIVRRESHWLREPTKETKTHWQELLERLISITQFLASHKLAFRGHGNTIFRFTLKLRKSYMWFKKEGSILSWFLRQWYLQKCGR
jgi:hypothetical protein